MTLLDTQIRTSSHRFGDPVATVRAFAADLAPGANDTTVFFCTSRTDLNAVAAAMGVHLHGQVIGCTTAGEITPQGHSDGTLTGFTMPVRVARMLPLRFDRLRDLASDSIRDAVDRFDLFWTDEIRDHPASHPFGLLLVDGLAGREELLAGQLKAALPEVAMAGGSAGDDLGFRKAQVFYDGAFHSDAAVYAVFATERPFYVFKTQHFVPTGTRMVVTDASPEQRLVRRINGRPAAAEYARLAGLTVAELTARTFSLNPVMVLLGGRCFVRSIQKALPDGSLVFLCAIDTGIVLHLGHAVDLEADLDLALSAAVARVGQPELLIGCECVLRRLEMQATPGLVERASALFRRHATVGFHTYGEQIEGVHVNQTFTGVAIGP